MSILTIIPIQSDYPSRTYPCRVKATGRPERNQLPSKRRVNSYPVISVRLVIPAHFAPVPIKATHLLRTSLLDSARRSASLPSRSDLSSHFPSFRILSDESNPYLSDVGATTHTAPIQIKATSPDASSLFHSERQIGPSTGHFFSGQSDKPIYSASCQNFATIHLALHQSDGPAHFYSSRVRATSHAGSATSQPQFGSRPDEATVPFPTFPCRRDKSGLLLSRQRDLPQPFRFRPASSFHHTVMISS